MAYKKGETVYRLTTASHGNIELTAPEKRERSWNLKLYFAVFVVNLLAFASGNSYAWSSTVLTILRGKNPEENPLGRPTTISEESWISSLISLGACLGTVLACYSSDKFGRHMTLLAFAIPMFVSHFIIAFARTPMLYCIARFMVGVGDGATFTVIPMYVGEISETKTRGILGCCMGVMISLGMVSVFIVGNLVNIKNLSFILMIPIAVFLVIFGLFIPESPYYYVANGDIASAKQSLKMLRKSSSIAKELDNIREVIEESKIEKSLNEAMKAKSFRKGITITTALMVLQHLMGISIILSYMQLIFDATESSMSASASTIIVAVVQTATVIFSSSLSDRWGRRPLLLIASAGTALPLALMGAFFYMKNIKMDVTFLWWLPVASLIIYVISYNFGLGAVSWMLVGELFASKTKAFASSTTALTCLSFGFVVTLLYPSVEKYIGYHGVFWLCSVNCVICLLFVFCYVPETKGKSFQEILRMLEQ